MFTLDISVAWKLVLEARPAPPSGVTCHDSAGNGIPIVMSTEQISLAPDESDRPDAGTKTPSGPEWAFAARPWWVMSHVFALSVVSLFVFLGLWQLDRLEQRQAENVLIAARTGEVPLVIDSVEPGIGPDGSSEAEDSFGGSGSVDFRRAVATGVLVDADVARITNRSQGGVAGEYVVALLEFDDGTFLAVNRGFVPINAAVELTDPPTARTEVSGWLRDTVEPEGWFAVADTGEGRLLPRFDTAALSSRVGQPLPPFFLQLAPDGDATADFPDPVPLPELSEGPHLSYAVQWFIFAILGTVFYLAVVRRRAHRAESDRVIA